MIGVAESNDGQFVFPVGLVIDKYNRLIVCDADNRRLQLFTLSGKFFSKLCGEAFNNASPRYAAMNNISNSLFVTNFNSRNIYVFY